MKLLKLLIVLLCLGYSVSAQEEPLTPPGILSTGDVLVATSDYPLDLRNITQLWLLDPFIVGKQQKLYLNIEREGYRVHDIEIARGGQYLLTLEIEGREDTGFVPLGKSELVRMNLETGQREAMFTGVNLVNFSLSPNAEQALIRFYPEEMTFVDRYDLLLREQWCVVTLRPNQGECRDLTFAEETYPRAFEWVSDDVLAYTLNYQDSIQILDTTTFTTAVIELPEGRHANEIRPILNTANLLVYDAPLQGEVGKLLLLDVPHRSFSEIGNLNYAPMSIMEISPDGNSLVMAGGNIGVLVNLQTGKIIQTYPTIYDMEWSSFQWLPTDHMLFLIGNLGFKGGNVMTVLFEPNFNVAVNIFTQLNGKLVIVP